MSDQNPPPKPIGAAEDARKRGRRAVMPPVVRASTFLATSLDDYEMMSQTRQGDAETYGVHGSDSVRAFERLLADMEGGWRARICSTGLTAAITPFLAYLSAGDHALVPDSVYSPVRGFCDTMMKRFGVAVTYYDPCVGSGIRDLIRPTTRLVYLESPGSLTFEVQDVRAICAVAADNDCWTAMDNTWASPLYFKPFEHGVDISIQALTKYVGGHSDIVLGSVTTTEAAYPTLQSAWRSLGFSASPDDVYLAHRGFKTLGLRMERHHASGLKLAEWLSLQPEVVEILHPALEGDPGHALWKRDFSGAGGLFGFTLAPEASDRAKLQALLDPMIQFGMGFSWGGTQSMLTPARTEQTRSAAAWPRPGGREGRLMRIYAGLEDPDLLIDDLRLGFQRLRAA